MALLHNVSSLAIVIPAYKKQFFREALGTLAAQTNKDFTVYIGDDNSPEDLFSVVEEFEGKLRVQYRKFPDNLGGKNLVAQWKRCIDLTKDEEWLWLFSDDDVLDPHCVENFYTQLANDKGRTDVYRFNTVIVDRAGRLVSTTPQGPLYESATQMAYHLLMGQRGNSMADHIFSRNVYEGSGGFVETDFAQGADWASSILFAKEKGISVIPGACLYWRRSGSNVSSLAAGKRNQMINGHLQFLAWVVKHFAFLKEGNESISFAMMLEAAQYNFVHVMLHHYRGFNWRYFSVLQRFLQNTLQLSALKAIATLLLVKAKTTIAYRWYGLFRQWLRNAHSTSTSNQVENSM